MKTRITMLLMAILLIAACKTKTVAVEAPKILILSPAAVSSAQKSKAYELGKRVLETCNTSRFKPFTTTEATAAVIKNTTEERLTQTCRKFRVKYGRFEDIKLVEVVQNKVTNTFVFRYKAEYQWKHTTKELRVSMNADNKVSAIQSRDWKDQYTP